MPVRAADGKNILGADCREQKHEVSLRSVAGYMEVFHDVAVRHARAFPIQLFNHVIDTPLIAGYGISRKNNRIPFYDAYKFVIIVGHARQRARCLPLRPRGDEELAGWRESF